jgi:DnaK suppressor protein
MTPAELLAFKSTLQRLRLQLVQEGPAKIEPNRKDPSTVGVADEDEQALSEMLQALASQRNKQQGELLAQIDRAIGKLDRDPDLVGLCEECEEEIDERRLRLMPYVTLCAECQQARDKKRGGTRRSTTEFI